MPPKKPTSTDNTDTTIAFTDRLEKVEAAIDALVYFAQRRRPRAGFTPALAVLDAWRERNVVETLDS